jgi:hypothetical protein
MQAPRATKAPEPDQVRSSGVRRVVGALRDPVVVDEGSTERGSDAIRAWRDRTS